MKAKERLRGIFGSMGASRHAGHVDDAEVVRTESGRNSRLFQFFQQSFIELAVGVEVALEQAVLDGALVELVGFLLLLFQSVMQHVFALQGSHVLPLDLAAELSWFRPVAER